MTVFESPTFNIRCLPRLKMLLHVLQTGLALMASVCAACASDPFIVTTKVTPSYWRATFSGAPLEIQGLSFFEDYYALIDRIAADQDVKVVVFDSNSPHYWLNHYDVVNSVPPELTWASYWGNVTRLANLPVLTVAAIRGHTSGGGAEIAASLDVRFGSREKAVYTQPEVGLGKFSHCKESQESNLVLTSSGLLIGVVPGGGGLDMLPRLMGRSRALEIILAAGDVDADTAAAYGCKPYSYLNPALQLPVIRRNCPLQIYANDSLTSEVNRAQPRHRRRAI